MKKTILLSALWLWSIFTMMPYARQRSVVEIPALKRLPVNAIHRIFQDSEGFIWYGTVNGLCRDDGYRIQVFRSDFNHPDRMEDNLIESITEDPQGRIWFGTDKGAYILDKKDYAIRAVDHPLLNGRMVGNLYTTSDGDIWLSVLGTLLRFDSSTCTCRHTYPIIDGEGKPSILAGFCESRKGEVIISVSEGLIYRLDKPSNRFIAFPDRMKHHKPGNLIQDKDGDFFWLCTWGYGLVRFTPSASPDSMFVYQPIKFPEQNSLMYPALDPEQNRLWITTFSHLTAFDISDGTAHPADDTEGLPTHVMLNEIIRDRRGDFWVSAFDCPSFILYQHKGKSLFYPLPELTRRCNYHPAVMALCDSGDGIMWMYQEREGVFLYDLNRNRATCHKQFATTAHLHLWQIKLITESRLKRAAWVVPEFKSTAYRLVRNNDMDMALADSIDFGKAQKDGAVTALYEEQRGQYIYAGTLKGLYRHDLSSGRTSTVCDTIGHVTAIIEDDDHTLYIGTYDKGVYLLPEHGTMRHIPLRQHLSCLTRTTDGTLWIGCSQGDFMALNPHDGSIRKYNKTCHLNGDIINRVMADEFNHIWIDTNQKIIEFNPRNGSYRTYLTTDGSAGLWRLIPTALCKGEDGNLYFGGIPGISRFTPSNDLEREAIATRTVITDLRTNGSSLFFDRNRTFGKDSVFEISADEQHLTICFSSLNYRVAHKIRYAYRLKGVDKEWQYAPEQTAEAVYSHLPKGTCDFEVKATDENGQWSRTSTVLHIRRLPAWYETWWAYLIYAGILLGGITYGTVLYVKRMKKRNEELWEDSKEMLRMRDYLNLTHEEENSTESENLNRILMDKAVRIVEENLSAPDFDVQRLAEAMNMSRSTLTRKLKSISGDTPLDFIRHIKMKHACRMLRDKQMNVTEVAAMLGYFNRKYFTSCFKDEFGMTPSEYQKKNNEE